MAEIDTQQLLDELSKSRESNEEYQSSLIAFLYGENGVAMESLGDLPRIFLEEGEENRKSLAESITSGFASIGKTLIGSLQAELTDIGYLLIEQFDKVGHIGQSLSNDTTVIDLLGKIEKSVAGPDDFDQTLASGKKGDGPEVSTISGGEGTGGFLSSIANAMAEFGDERVRDGADTLLVVGSSLLVTAGALVIFNHVEWESLAKGFVTLGGLFVMLKALDKVGKKGAATLVSMSAALAISAGSLIAFNYVEWESVGKGAVSIGLLGAMTAGLGKLAPHIIQGSIALGAMGLSFLAAGIGFQSIGDVEWGNAFAAILPIAGLGLTLAGLGLALPYILPGAIAMGAMGLAFLVSSSGFQAIGEVEWENTLSAVIPVAALGLTMAGLGLAMPFILAGSLAMTTMGVAFLLASPGFTDFGQIEWEGVSSGVLTLGALSVTMAGLGLAMPFILLGSISLGIMSKAIGYFAEKIKPILGQDLTGLSQLSQAFSDITESFENLPGLWASGKAGIKLAALGSGLSYIARPLLTLSKVSWEGLSKAVPILPVIFGTLAGVGSALDSDDLDIFKELAGVGTSLKGLAEGIIALSGITTFPDLSAPIGNLLKVIDDESHNTNIAELGPYMFQFAEGIEKLSMISGFDNLARLSPALREILDALDDEAHNVDLSMIGPHLKDLAVGIFGLSQIKDTDTLRNLVDPLAGILDALDDEAHNVDLSKIGPHLKDLASGIYGLSLIPASGLEKLVNPLANILDAIEDQADGVDISKVGPHLSDLASGLYGLSLVDGKALDSMSGPLIKIFATLDAVGNKFDLSKIDPDKLKSISDFAQVMAGVDGNNLEIVAKALSNIDFPSIEVRHTLESSKDVTSKDKLVTDALAMITDILKQGNIKTDELIAKMNDNEINVSTGNVIDTSRDYPNKNQLPSTSFR